MNGLIVTGERILFIYFFSNSQESPGTHSCERRITIKIVITESNKAQIYLVYEYP